MYVKICYTCFNKKTGGVSTEFLFKRYFKIGGVINYENKNKERDEFTRVD